MKYSHVPKILLCTSAFVLSGCVPSQSKISIAGKRNSANASSKQISISNVRLVNNQFILSGAGLDSATQIEISDGGATHTLQIESQGSNSLVANTLSNVTLSAGKILNFVISNAQASATFTIDFTLCDSTLAGKGFNCSVTPNDKDVLSYDHTSGKWKPRSINGLTYEGAWDATGSLPSSSSAGEYYIVSVANSPYNVGDWIVFNGSSFDRIDNSQAIVNVYGRTGAITANKGDYTFTKLADVDLTTTPPVNGNFLKYNGTNWVPATITTTSGTVTSVSVTAPLTVATASTTPALAITQSSGSTNGYLSSTDWTAFNNKQASITASDSTKYYRGDKTWQTLDTTNVTENTNLYFTNSRALGVVLTGLDVTTTGSVAATDTVLSAFGKTQRQLNSLTSGGSSYLIKNGTDTVTGQVTIHASTGALKIPTTPSGVDLTDAANVQYVNNYADNKIAKAGGTMTGDLQVNTNILLRDSGSNTVSMKAPSTVTTSYVLTFPATAGSSNQVLTTNGSGTLSWTTPSGGGAVSSVNTKTGAVVLSTSDVSEGTNLYFTDARTLAAPITAPTLTNSAIATSDTIQVAFGKLQAQINNTISKVLTGLSTASSSAIAATDSIVDALGKLQAQINSQTTSIGTKADQTNGTQTITAAVVTGLSAPVAGSDAANKTYIDSFAQWVKSGSDAYRATGKIGIGNTSPQATLDVSGEVRIGNSSVACSASNTGAQRYNSSQARMEFCDGTSWQVIGSTTPVGAVQAFAQSTCPSGWLTTDGSAVSRTTYSALFSALATDYGIGDGSTTFNIPDYRGYFLRGWSNGSGTDPDSSSRADRGDGTTGDYVGTKQIDALGSHSHLLKAVAASGGVGVATNSFLGKSGGAAGNIYSNVSVPDTNLNSASIGNTGVAETRPKNINVLYCIKF